ITFESKHEDSLSRTIGVLLSSNKKGHFNDLITILEDKEYVLICSLLEPLYRKALDKQKLNERTLFNYKQDIINAYNINKDASDKKIHELQKTLIDLYLIKYDRILVDNTDGDLFYLHRIEQFKKLSNEIKDKTNEQIENILAQCINREIFHRLTTIDEHRKEFYFHKDVIDSIGSISIPDSQNTRKHLSRKNLDYFFDKNGVFLKEKAKQLNEYSVIVNLHDGAKIYDCSWSNPNEFQEKYQILIDLYSSYRIDLLREMIRRPLNEQNFQSNLIDIARQVTYLLRVKTEDALIELESNIQIEVIGLIYYCLFCSLNENEIDIALKCLKSIIDKTWNIRLCSNVPESIANDQEIVIVKIDTTFSIYYRMNGQTEHCSIDNEQYVRSLSLVDFKQQTIPRDIYEKISTIVFEIIQFSVLEIEVHTGNDEQFEKLIKLFSTKEEKHAVHWILSFIGDKESEMKKLNDIFILKPVLSWYEELSEFKVELVRDRIFKKFSDDLEKTSDENRDKFQNAIQASLFFAENHRDSWFELMKL
ncbi:unnamed protein product, partial [Rotaria magnacalcarata]